MFQLEEFASSQITKPLNHTPLVFKLDSNVINNLVDFCGAIQALRVVHKRIRSAGKGVKFIESELGTPEPVPTASQRKALQKYDQRRLENSVLFGNSGTILYNFQIGSNSILLTCRSHFKYSIPIAGSELFLPTISNLPLEVEGSNYLVTGRFKPIEIFMPYLTRLVKNLSPQARDEVAQIYMLLYLIKQMLREKPIYALFQTLQIGYILDSPTLFLDSVKLHFLQLIKVASEVVAEVKLPDSAESLVTNLSTLSSKTWPPGVGTLIKISGDSLLVDMVAASSRLDAALSFIKEVTNGLDKERADQFELRDQELLDRTTWSPKAPEIKKLTGVKLKRKAEGIYN